MAQALLGVVAEGLLTKALSLATEEISGVLGVRNDLESLAKQLEMIQALLYDAESKSITIKTVELWLKSLEDAAADGDNLLDEFAYEVLRKKMLKGKKDKVRSFFSSSNPLVCRFRMASKIKKINLRMGEIFQNSNRIGLSPAEIMNSPADPRRVSTTAPFVDASKIVGRDGDVEEIVSLLTCSKDERDLSVIGIVGMPGQGKTAVAQLLMKNDEVKKHFEKIIWTFVSEDFKVDRVLNDMLQSLTKKVSEFTNREALVKKLNEEIDGKRFLLVLDDVWNEDSELWDQMNNCLQALGGSKESRIILTTRNERVVSVMNGFVYRLGVLSEEASKDLFEKIAFGIGGAAKTHELVKIGERIVKRCGGVPLAVKATGALMSSKRDELEWLKIEESNIWSTLDGVCCAIRLSFDHLPSLSLKQCFVLCSIFPKGTVIDMKELIQFWMAHGLLNPSKESRLEMEDVGNNYVNILLQRSLLQEAKINEYGSIMSCKMHDLVHDFALEASKGLCLNVKGGVLNNDTKTVHLSIFANEREHLSISEKNFLTLRTLCLSGGICYRNFLVQCKCKYLRVLTVVDWQMEDLPMSIAKLKHLRYLDICRTRISVLPDFVSKLYNLQTLRLPFLPNLPKYFGRLVNLRHLYIEEEDYGWFRNHKPHLLPGIGQLASLRALLCFPASPEKGCQIEELSTLYDLEGFIRIAGLENVANRDDAKKGNLSGKRNIESLELCWDSQEREGSADEEVLEGLQPHPSLKALKIANYMGKNPPSWLVLLRNLVNIKLSNLNNCEQVPPLGHLPCLKVVAIFNMNNVKCIGNEFYGWTHLASSHSSQTSAAAFPSLKELDFGRMSSLEEWSDAVHPTSVFSATLFPCLEKLRIVACPNLTRLPECLSDLANLKNLEVAECHKLVSVPDVSNLHALNMLWIYDCPELSALPRGIEGLRSLQTLYIPGPASVVESLLHYFTNLKTLVLDLSKKIDYFPLEPKSNTEDNIEEHNPFATLQSLLVVGIPELKYLPENIQHLTALRVLTLRNFDGLEALPEWLGNFHSLRNIHLVNCKSLKSFPSVGVMQALTNLKFLSTSNCPLLKQRCERGSGAEWHKIARIPQIGI